MALLLSLGTNISTAAPRSGRNRIIERSGKPATFVTGLPHEQVSAHKRAYACQHQWRVILNQSGLDTAEYEARFLGRTADELDRTVDAVAIEEARDHRREHRDSARAADGAADHAPIDRPQTR